MLDEAPQSPFGSRDTAPGGVLPLGWERLALSLLPLPRRAPSALFSSLVPLLNQTRRSVFSPDAFPLSAPLLFFDNYSVVTVYCLACLQLWAQFCSGREASCVSAFRSYSRSDNTYWYQQRAGCLACQDAGEVLSRGAQA